MEKNNNNLSNLIQYLNSIDVSLCDSMALDTIYNEISGHEAKIILVQDVTFTLERFFAISSADQCMSFLQKIDIAKLCCKSLGSRAIESILDRLFTIIYIENENTSEIEKDSVIDSKIVFEKLFDFFPTASVIQSGIRNENGCHVIRKLFNLLAGKRFNKQNEIIKYKHQETVKYIKNVGANIRAIKLDKIKEFYSYFTLAQYIKLFKSQRAIAKFMKVSANEVSSVLCESMIEEANEENLKALAKKFKFYKPGRIEETLLIYSKEPLYKGKYDKIDENMKIASVHNMINCNAENLREFLMVNFEIKSDIFYDLILKKYSIESDMSIDSKYVDIVCRLFSLSEFGMEMALSFVKYFSQGEKDDNHFIGTKLFNSKSARKIIKAFVEGDFDIDIKRDYFDKNINLFFKNYKWNECEDLMLKVILFTEGHTKKKAGDILRKINKS